MNLDYLRTFLEVVRLGSFSEVAKKLGISQPAVSFQIQRLERELGVQLIDRSQKTVVMTPAGKRLLVFADFWDREDLRLKQDLDSLRDEVSGELAIAASTVPGEFILPAALAGFKALHPSVQIRVEVSDSSYVIKSVKEGIFDAGVCGARPEKGELECIGIARDEIVLIVFPEHPFARRREIALTDLVGEPFIFREKTSGTQRSLESLLAGSGLKVDDLTPSLVLGSTVAVLNAVEARAGIAFISSLAIKKSLSLGLVKQVAVDDLRFCRDFYCVYRQASLLSRLLREFVSYMQSQGPGVNPG